MQIAPTFAAHSAQKFASSSSPRRADGIRRTLFPVVMGVYLLQSPLYEHSRHKAETQVALNTPTDADRVEALNAMRAEVDHASNQLAGKPQQEGARPRAAENPAVQKLDRYERQSKRLAHLSRVKWPSRVAGSLGAIWGVVTLANLRRRQK